jgi:hypothetical protein
LFIKFSSALGQGTIIIGPPHPPANNAFTNALSLSGSLITLSNQPFSLATAEPGEPSHGGTAPFRSVWYRWTAPHSGEVDLALTSPVRLGIGVYQGHSQSLSNLVPVSQSHTSSNHVRWLADAGDEFVFAVNQPGLLFSQFIYPVIPYPTSFNLRLVHGAVALAAPLGRVGKVGVPISLQFESRDTNFSFTRLDVSAGTNQVGSITNLASTLTWLPQTGGILELTALAQTSTGDSLRMVPESFSIAPANDLFAEALSLPPILTNHTTTFSTHGASLEPGEPNYGNINPPFRGSLWWKWQPQHTTLTEYAAIANHLFIFEGDTIDNLTPLNPLQVVPIIIRAWDGNGSFSSIPPLPVNARFTNYARKTYWFSAVTTADTNATWTAAQRLHWLSAANGRSDTPAQQPFRVNVAGIDGLFPPSNINIRALKYVFNGNYWTPTLTAEVTIPNSSDLSWSWIPESPGEYDLRATGQYPSGESWQHAIRISVREANDTLAAAPTLTGTTNLPFSTAHATVDPDEPTLGTNSIARTVWWRWRSETNASVRFSVSESFGGLPLEVFTESEGTLTRVAHNDCRTFLPPLRGFVPLHAVAGVDYIIRLSDPATSGLGLFGFSIPAPRNHTLSIENLDDPMPGLVFTSTVLGTPNHNTGQIDWHTYARVLLADGTPATNFNYRAQFYAGETLSQLRPLSPAVYIFQQPGTGVPGSISAGLTNTPVPAGQNFCIQLRAWDSDFGLSYEAARANGGLIGRTPILEVLAGSELTGPTTLTNLSDIRLITRLNNFTPGELYFKERSISRGPVFELRAPRGFLYSVDAQSGGTEWQSILLLTNLTGSATFSDPRENATAATILRTRIVD